jgi:hypothetical protein
MSNKNGVIITSRVTHQNKNKLKRYFDFATLREILKAIIYLSENNSYIKNKMNETIIKNREKIK